ncbi:MAG: CoA ester lyase [candidate division KSB1 bacterium]|nr:CoA ester lyase [candidate division KSB1 bacterium]
MTVLRSLLFVPGNRSDMLQKAVRLTPDAFVPDMEDSVSAPEKGRARELIASFLPELAASGVPVIPRVNALDTGLLEADLAAVVGPYSYGVSVGKVSTPRDVEIIADTLARLELQAGIPVGQTRLVPWLETALAIVRAYEICTASPRIVAVAFGAEDFTHDMAIARTEDDSEVAVPRNLVCIAARAANVLALDTPYFLFRDPEGLQRNALASKKIGFKGKFAIHPAQLDIINATFSPSPEEIDYARRVVAAFAEAERAGKGATSLDGKVVDVPVVKRARALLEVAEHIASRQQAS